MLKLHLLSPIREEALAMLAEHSAVAEVELQWQEQLKTFVRHLGTDASLNPSCMLTHSFLQQLVEGASILSTFFDEDTKAQKN